MKSDPKSATLFVGMRGSARFVVLSFSVPSVFAGATFCQEPASILAKANLKEIKRFAAMPNGLGVRVCSDKFCAKAGTMGVLNSVSSLSDPVTDRPEMNSNTKTWLQLYVDAMTEKDPYKRLALVQELRKIPRHDESEEIPQESRPRSVPPKIVRRRH
jgi:hypothetical protein